MFCIYFLMIWISQAVSASSHAVVSKGYANYTWQMLMPNESIKSAQLDPEQVTRIYTDFENRFKAAYDQLDASEQKSDIARVFAKMFKSDIFAWEAKKIPVEQTRLWRRQIHDCPGVKKVRHEVSHDASMPGTELCDVLFLCAEYKVAYLDSLKGYASSHAFWPDIAAEPLEFLKINIGNRLSFSATEKSIWFLILKEIDIALIRTLFGADIC